ncbi:oligosaccharide flippase family protein [Ruthenibacterium sp. TH_2024_36131]
MFTRLMTTDQYGQFNLYQSWLGIITIFGTLNLFAGVFNNGMLKYEHDRDRYTSATQGLSSLAALVVVMAYLIAPNVWSAVLGLPHIVIISMLVEIFFLPALQYWMMRQRFEYHYRALVMLTIFTAVVNPLLGLVAVQASSEKGVARILSVSLLNAVIGIFFYVLNFYRGRRFFHAAYWKFALAFNLPLIPHYLAQFVLGQSDRIMIEKFSGMTKLAIYGLAYSIGLIMTIVTNSINYSFIPWTYQACKMQQYDRLKKCSMLLVLLVAFVSLVPVLMAPEIICIMGPPEYSEAVYVIPPIALSGYLIFVYSLFANIEFYFEQNRFVMLGSCAAAVLNVVLNLIFMPRFGYIAAAYTTVACYFILAVAHYLLMRRILKNAGISESLYHISLIIIITAVLVVMLVLCVEMYPYPLIRYGMIFMILLVCFAKKNTLLEMINRQHNKEENV